jgi:hypothetical protein
MVLLQIITTLCVAIAMATALAHALELPGKLRLTREQYETVQPIYFPGFTIAGMSEPLSVVLLGVLVLLTSPETTAFWLSVGAFVAMVVMHSVFWFMTQPVNKRWMRNVELKGASGAFFKAGPSIALSNDWRASRNRWERSHVVRTVLSFVALTLLVVSSSL